MSGGYYHTPPKPISTRVRCPVCHQEVYSRSGIHPQCAVRQSDSPASKNKGKNKEIDSPGKQPGGDVVVDPPTVD